jgi:hypothetical protein
MDLSSVSRADGLFKIANARRKKVEIVKKLRSFTSVPYLPAVTLL